ncbi:uncharacterized protein LOC143286656 [Babylonia areolata]|uniref:uncharacterized protein LOC143286656 n=1 Tax=Babylonia areolata TaxID=304850 RepID=UPI003FD1C50E
MWTMMMMLALAGTSVLFCDPVLARCTRTTKSNNTGGSCTFDFNYCGWTDDLNWVRVDRFHFGQNSYIRSNFSDASTGSEAHLYSPRLCATGSDAFRSLTFRYSIEKSDRCRLSVFVETLTHRQKVWETREGTGISFSRPVPPILLRCSDSPFQIVFVARKLTGEPCGNMFDEVDVDDIVYRDAFMTSSPYHDCATFPGKVLSTTSHPPVSSTDQTNSEEDIGAGAVVGVVVVIVVVVSVVAVGVYCILSRKKNKRKLRDLDLQTKTRSMTNYIYTTDSARFITADHGPSRSADVREDEDDTYDAAYDTARPSSAIYSVADDLDLDLDLPPTVTPTHDRDLSNNVRPPLPRFTGPSGTPSSTLSRDSSASGASRYHRLVHFGPHPHPHPHPHPLAVQNTQRGHEYDHLVVGTGQESAPYADFGQEDDDTFSHGGRGAGKGGQQPKAACDSSAMESEEYIDMGQGHGPPPDLASLARGGTNYDDDDADDAVYENPE